MNLKTYGKNSYLNNSPIKKHIQNRIREMWDFYDEKFNFVDVGGWNVGSCSGCSYKMMVFTLDEMMNK